MVAIGMSFGALHGYAINPARDLGPRLWTLLAGFQNNGFEELRIWTVPIIGPIVGAVLGAFIYDYAIGKPLERADLAARGDVRGMDVSNNAGPQ
ncbi:aquaporin [Deinococcus lacus]|uniref:Aquaporin n=1 Tax=Deinococcus lacus TaxID=392561 RepID=A0ABW1Y9M4_9DEIO